MSACKIETFDESGPFSEEVIGADHFQALAFGIFHLAAFFARHAAVGNVTWPDGGPYHPEQDLLLSVRSTALRERIEGLGTGGDNSSNN